MTRTTPPRSVDIARIFPALRDHSATTTRLHPRPGRPTAADSSIGGPVLWPADEPWPRCTDRGAHYVDRLWTPAMTRRSRQIYAAAQARAAATGGPRGLTDDERAELPELDYSEPLRLVKQPIPLIPVAQLRREDIPDFAGPEGTDLLQVLWCPLDHPSEGYNPRVQLFWRRGADIAAPLETIPEPPVVNPAYLPEPCVVHPEQVREFQHIELLPDELREQIAVWEVEAHGGDGERAPDALSYDFDLSLAPGWKVGGFADWSLTGPDPVDCTVCGAAMALLFTADSGEWCREGVSWRPLEEPVGASPNPTCVIIGRGYVLHVFRCPASFDHPHVTVMQ